MNPNSISDTLNSSIDYFLMISYSVINSTNSLFMSVNNRAVNPNYYQNKNYK